MKRAFIIDKEDVRARRLGDVAPIIKHQRVGETLFLGSMLRKRADHVKTGGLGMNRRGFGRWPLPVRHIEGDSLHLRLGIEIAWPFPGGDGDMRTGVLRRNRHHLGAAPAEGPHIAVGNAIGLDNGHLRRVHLVIAERNIEIHDVAGIAEPFGMLAPLEDTAGIDALALEHQACIMQTVAERMGFGIAPGQQLAIQPDGAVAIIERDQSHFFLLRCPGGV